MSIDNDFYTRIIRMDFLVTVHAQDLSFSYQKLPFPLSDNYIEKIPVHITVVSEGTIGEILTNVYIWFVDEMWMETSDVLDQIEEHIESYVERIMMATDVRLTN